MSGRRAILRPEARRAAIFDMVEKNGNASVELLAERFDTSVETVRRDLSLLADQGRVRKVHGGAVKISTSEESAFGERAKQNTLAKQLVAEKLAKVVSPGQSLLIDTGTTTLACAEALSKIANLIVITNSTRIAGVISGKENGSKVILLGGTFRHDNAQTIGPTTIAEIGHFRVDHAILTVGTIDKRGISDFSQEEALVARAMIDAAEKVTVVADCSKLNRRTTYHVCDLRSIDRLILDYAPDAEIHEIFRSVGVEVL